MTLSTRKWLLLSLAFSAIVLFIVVFSTIDEHTFLYVQQINIWFLVAALGLRLLSFGLWALRIQLMARSLGYNVGFLHCYNMVMANLLLGAITPGQAGGEPIRVYELYKADVPAGDATAIVVLERVFDAIILVVLGVISLIFMLDVIRMISAAVLSFMVLSMILMIFALCILIYGFCRPEPAKKIIMKVLLWVSRKVKRPLAGKLFCLIDAECDNFFKTTLAFSKASRSGLYSGIACSVGFWVSEFIVASVILMGLGLVPHIFESLLFQIAIAIINMVPLTPGASGIAEISATSLYAFIVPTSILGVFILLWRLIMFYFNVLLGFIGSLVIFRREVSTSGGKTQSMLDSLDNKAKEPYMMEKE